MRILFDNVNFSSRSGPNTFGSRLAKSISYKGHTIVNQDENPDVQLSFIQSSNYFAPTVQRLDGIWFNIDQNWKLQNKAIEDTYKKSKSVIFQSEFNKKLVEEYFGKHESSFIIHNGTFVSDIQAVDPLDAPSLAGTENVWVCASSWRPHKRLKDNIRYFLEHSGKKDCLIIAGANPDCRVADPRIFYAGDLPHHFLIPLFRAADYFIHLAWLDHCPNVVVDARAAGAKIICSSAGGTREIAGTDAIIVEEDEWDFKPCKLYNPPELDFTRKIKNDDFNVSIEISEKTEAYENVLLGVI